jgi:hypothetical protein
MQQDPENSSRLVSGQAVSKPKKAYVKPSFRSEKIFETMALQCGKVQSTQSSCHYNRKNS